MNRMFQVRSTRAPCPSNRSWGPLPRTACVAAAPRPSRRPAPHVAPLLPCFPFDSADRVRVQPAAALQHLQRHNHGGYVLRALRACPLPRQPPQLGSLPCALLLAPPPPHPSAATEVRPVAPEHDASAERHRYVRRHMSTELGQVQLILCENFTFYYKAKDSPALRSCPGRFGRFLLE